MRKIIVERDISWDALLCNAGSLAGSLKHIGTLEAREHVRQGGTKRCAGNLLAGIGALISQAIYAEPKEDPENVLEAVEAAVQALYTLAYSGDTDEGMVMSYAEIFAREAEQIAYGVRAMLRVEQEEEEKHDAPCGDASDGGGGCLPPPEAATAINPSPVH